MGAGYLAYLHYNNLQETVRELREENVKLQVSIDLQQETIEAQQGAIREWRDALKEFGEIVEESARVSQDAASETRKLDDTLSDSDLEELAKRKPGLIERRINDGTARAYRLLECATGASHPDCPDNSGAPSGSSANP